MCTFCNDDITAIAVSKVRAVLVEVCSSHFLRGSWRGAPPGRYHTPSNGPNQSDSFGLRNRFVCTGPGCDCVCECGPRCMRREPFDRGKRTAMNTRCCRDERSLQKGSWPPTALRQYVGAAATRRGRLLTYHRQHRKHEGRFSTNSCTDKPR